jgi:hypothetical protein
MNKETQTNGTTIATKKFLTYGYLRFLLGCFEDYPVREVSKIANKIVLR